MDRRAVDRRARTAARAGAPSAVPPRRPDCPWCGSGRLRPAAGPAGGVPFEECARCGHVFQNPRPRPRPSDGEGPLARRLAAHLHRSAARALLPLPEPESWLDVGTGEGRFPAAAREFFPYTSFDGLDTRLDVLRAQAAGRVEEAHVGRVTDPPVAARLRARYDVVSMLHHLESAPDPRAELHAALTLLRPGGHLLLHVTGPRGATSWPGPARPHLLPRRNVEAELHAAGCPPVTTRTRPYLPTGYRLLARRS
ncbi:MAG TPA: class I SAM-dependent methyltransferase [Streptomyces sp.]|nr:class I SAM-dependent methyltransferase [Streptomyces sp.]